MGDDAARERGAQLIARYNAFVAKYGDSSDIDGARIGRPTGTLISCICYTCGGPTPARGACASCTAPHAEPVQRVVICEKYRDLDDTEKLSDFLTCDLTSVRKILV